jgi:hypothetical protein
MKGVAKRQEGDEILYTVNREKANIGSYFTQELHSKTRYFRADRVKDSSKGKIRMKT